MTSTDTTRSSVSDDPLSGPRGSERIYAKVNESASRRDHRRVLLNVALYVASIGAALLIASALVLLATDASPIDVMSALYEGSLSNGAAIGLTLEQATPILIVALGVVIASRAGIFTIGPEGQFLIGGLCTAFAMFELGLPPALSLPIGLLAGALGGALWASIAAALRFTRGVDVIISTLLLNLIATEVVSFCLNKTWLLQEQVDRDVLPPQSARIAERYRIPEIGSAPGFQTTAAIFIAVALVVIVWFALSKTRWGFRVRMLGTNASAARAAGVSLAVVGGGALAWSGAFAGLSGGIWLTGIGERLSPGFGGTMAGEGLLVALISRRQPLVVVPIALYFGALRSGGGYLASTGVPANIVDIVQALVVLAALLPPPLLTLIDRRRAVRVARQAAQQSAAPTPALAEAVV